MPDPSDSLPNETSDRLSQEDASAHGGDTTEKLKIETENLRPSGAAYVAPFSVSTEFQIVFFQVLSSVYAGAHPLNIAISAAALLLLGSLGWALSLLPESYAPQLPASHFELESLQVSSLALETLSPKSPTLMGDAKTFGRLPIPSSWPALGMNGMVFVWQEMVSPWADLGQIQSVGAGRFWARLIGCLASLLVWSFAGTMICRSVASSTILGRSDGLESAKYARRHYWDAVLSIMTPLLLAIALAAPLAIAGLLLIGDWSSAIGSVIALPLLILCLPAAVILLGLLLAWPLMFPAIAIEGRDSFESISRSYAYALQRPLHLLMTAVAAAVIGGIVAWLFFCLAEVSLQFFYGALSWGSNVWEAEHIREIVSGVGANGEPLGGVSESFTAPTLRSAAGLVSWILRAAVYSIFWAAATAVYLLMRRYLDQAPLDQIYIEGQQKLNALE